MPEMSSSSLALWLSSQTSRFKSRGVAARVSACGWGPFPIGPLHVLRMWSYLIAYLVSHNPSSELDTPIEHTTAN